MTIQKFIAALATAALFVSPLQADDETTVISHLSEARTRDQLTTAVREAQRLGMSAQRITEAKLLFGIKTQDSLYLTSLLPDLENQAIGFTPQKSLAGISTVEQWRSLISYVRAMNALEKKDTDTFRTQILDAIWNFPQQAQLFGSAIEKFQLQEKMEQWVIDFATPLLEAGGKETTLGTLLGSKKALLLVFWSSNVKASVDSLPMIQKLASTLRPNGISVVAVNADSKDAEENAIKVRDEKSLTLPFLIESSQRTLIRQIEITSLPRAVLITQQGRVIFHGHPMDQGIWKALKRIAPAIQPPSL